jgi:hypothetical protein
MSETITYDYGRACLPVDVQHALTLAYPGLPALFIPLNGNAKSAEQMAASLARAHPAAIVQLWQNKGQMVETVTVELKSRAAVESGNRP